MFDTLIAGGTIVNADGVRQGDVGIIAGKVAAIVPAGESVAAGIKIDASGKYLLPGLIDSHAHLREPGLTHKENFESGTRAAALGGVTTVLDMPTDEPWTANADQLSEKMKLAERNLHVDVGFQAVIGEDVGPLDELLALHPVSLEVFTADVPRHYMFDNLDAVREILKRLAPYNTLVGISPGDQSILAGATLRNGAGDIAAFLDSRSRLAEAGGIARAILAAADTGVRIHVRQINSVLGIDVWRRLRDLSDATVETTPQNFFFTADDYERSGPNLKGSPPFRDREDVQALRSALSEGLIDIIATDHAPHSPSEKAMSYGTFADIPGGMPGLQTLLLVMLKLVDDGVIRLTDLVRMCAYTPARRFGLGRSKGAIDVGYDADIIVVDRRHMSQISNAEQASRAAYTPFHGWNIPAKLTDVFLRGERIVIEGTLVVPGRGRVVTRRD